jgi:DNA mismatch repair protein MutL
MATTPRIRLLDPTVANQIAAGEVVERPASVVKELVENALDAGAGRVVIRLQDGGQSLISVSDDGCGMGPDDARLAFARHATSKLQVADDLVDLHTYGFRGEALASILAVSRVTLTTRRAEDAVGVRLQGAGGVDLQAQPAGCNTGTTIEIRDLFFNVPARLKFLRTAATELGQVLKFIDALALARPDLHLTLFSGERRVADYPPDADLRRRAEAVLGVDVAARLYEVQDDREYRVRGLLSEPSLHHGGAGQLTLLVGGRPVQDRTLAQAVLQAYGTLLERGRYPVGVLALDCPPGTVDVNVHPAKTEVRFASSSAVFSAVLRAVQPMLAATPWIKQQLPSDEAAVAPVNAARWSEGAATAGGWAGVADSGMRAGSSWSGSKTQPTWGVPRAPLSLAPSRGPTSDAMPQPAQPLPFDPGPALGQWAGLRYVGQVGRCYLVCESEDAMVLIDQHAAHERIIFEQLVVAMRSGPFPSQQLLTPIAVPLAPVEVAALAAETALLERLGFELVEGGERMVRVRAYPSLLPDRQIAAEVRHLAVSLAQGGRGQDTETRLERCAATLACHSAYRAGDLLYPDDVARLLRDMDGVDLSAYCPHGRPVFARTRLEEVGRWFHRS